MTFERRLIAEVKKYECLYNLKCPNYKDIPLKEKVWQRIARTCGANAAECKRKWKHLRDSFQRSRKQKLALAKGHRATSTKPHKMWRYEKHMEFLTECPFSRPPRNNPIYSDDDSSDYFTPLSKSRNNVSTQTEVVYSEVEHLEDMDMINEKVEPNTESDFQPDIDTNSLEETIYPKFMESNVTETSEACTIGKEEDSTTLMFKMLDRKVKQAALTEEQLTDFETSIILFVYKRLAETQK